MSDVTLIAAGEDEKGNSRGRRSDSPAKRRDLLQAWLAIENLVNGEGSPWRRRDGLLIEPQIAYREAERAEEEEPGHGSDVQSAAASLRTEVKWWPTLSDVREYIEEYSERFGNDPESADKRAYSVGYKVASIFDAIRENRQVFIDSESLTIVDPANDRITHNEPLRGLFEALKPLGGLAGRIGRCPICAKTFYALRGPGKKGKFGTKACSRECSQVRKQREYRKRDRERAEKACRLKQEGKDVREVARILGVRVPKARSFIARAKRENKR